MRALVVALRSSKVGLLLIVLFSLALVSCGGGGGGGGGAAAATLVTTDDLKFDPAQVTLAAGQPVTLALDNKGGALDHDLVIDALNVQVTVGAGQTAQAQLNAKKGTYDFYCSIPGHKEAGMVGKLVLK